MPVLPDTISENKLPDPNALAHLKSGKGVHQFAVVEAGRTVRILSKIIFPDAGRLVTHEAGLCNDALIVYNCW